jgi:GNAT superfamily N-acetyltransferase
MVANISPLNARHKLLSLTDAGRTAFADLDAGTRTQIGGLLERLDPGAIGRLTHAMRDIMAILGDATPATGNDVILRAPRSGDLGWVIHRQAVLYADEYGWDWQYEGLVASILSRFVAEFDDAREQAWIAEHRGRIAGSIFLMRSDDPDTAKLRLLYVEPDARGNGIGHGLVAACIDRARAIGYRRLTLWTNDVLVAARRIYEAASFTLRAEEPHHSFGHDLVGQTWTLDL